MMTEEQLTSKLVHGMDALKLNATEQQVQQLMDYLQLLVRWNQAYNLTAIRDPAEMICKHLLDSLSILPYVEGKQITDVGSGAGLPGIPLAIMRPEMSVLSIDSNGKKTRFQFQVKSALKLDNFVVQQARTETFQPATRSQQLVSRAFASLGDFLRLTGPLATEDARWLAMKGQYPEDELKSLPKGFICQQSHLLQVLGEEGQRHLLILVKQA
jgi:16S rRNA (guanine527-N7)-methyltransferase